MLYPAELRGLSNPNYYYERTWVTFKDQRWLRKQEAMTEAMLQKIILTMGERRLDFLRRHRGRSPTT